MFSSSRLPAALRGWGLVGSAHSKAAGQSTPVLTLHERQKVQALEVVDAFSSYFPCPCDMPGSKWSKAITDNQYSEPTPHLKMGAFVRYLAIIIGISTSLTGCGEREAAVLKIGESTYRFPVDAMTDNQNQGDAYVRFDVGRSSDGRLTNSSISLEFNEQYNRTQQGRRALGSAAHDAQVPAVRWVIVGSDINDLLIVKRPWGDVVCRRNGIKFDSPLACGTTFQEAGAQWQVLFHHEKLNENKDITSEARSALHKIRI